MRFRWCPGRFFRSIGRHSHQDWHGRWWHAFRGSRKWGD